MSAIISLDDYFVHGYPKPPDEVILTNAIELLARWNELLEAAALDGVHPMLHPKYGGAVADGWRPPGMGSPNSKHRTGCALDGSDHGDRRLAVWICKNIGLSKEIGLWWEDFRWTKGKYTNWCHGQTVAASKRIYIPYQDIVAKPPTDPDFYTRNGLDLATLLREGA